MDAYETAYQQGLKEEMIARVRKLARAWRNGDIHADDCMYDIETWCDEIWGEDN